MKKHLRDALPIALGTLPVSIVMGVTAGESFTQILSRCIGVTAISFALIALCVWAYWKLAMQRHPK